MIIFGWRTTQKKLCNAGVYRCNHCNNDVMFEIWVVTSWFTLFFIPTIPYRKEYFFLCPICQCGQELSKAQALEIQNPSLVIENASQGAENNYALIHSGIEEQSHPEKSESQQI